MLPVPVRPLGERSCGCTDGSTARSGSDTVAPYRARRGVVRCRGAAVGDTLPPDLPASPTRLRLDQLLDLWRFAPLGWLKQ